MFNFLLGLIIGSISSKSNLNSCSSKSVAAPKPKLPPRPSKIGANPPSKSKSPGPPGSSKNKFIELKFCKEFNWNNVEIIELSSYREFFIFYMENHEKGLIYDVKLIEGELI